MKSVYEQIGGEPAMQAAVELFYRKVLSDDKVSPFFENVDMDVQMAKQKAFLTMVCGGPNEYTGKDMRKAHAPLIKQGLNDEHVDIIVRYLGETLTELGVKPELIKQVVDLAESARNDVLNR